MVVNTNYSSRKTSRCRSAIEPFDSLRSLVGGSHGVVGWVLRSNPPCSSMLFLSAAARSVCNCNRHSLTLFIYKTFGAFVMVSCGAMVARLTSNQKAAGSSPAMGMVLLELSLLNRGVHHIVNIIFKAMGLCV